ncbi:cobalt transporter CbiM [Crassaminicella thermophila]|uniref:Cobalt transporter CbiM n=1 Tax=Crassaminicella thermophila TaxID=2599308 RepID=A0A5C0SGP4_CRATE|nr:cobalt transporter CbiM [Crassaminicella thermophila]QEK13370.1 cobalt transporter CbiM [Crassaminicella thermophila]
MHIPDGMLPVSVCAVGYGITGITTGYYIKKIQMKEDPKEDIPKASLTTAAFFVASLIHIPIPPTSVHLLLTGLLGILLGEYAFLSVVVSLFFQAVMFQHGGLTTLGVNAVIIGIPAVVSSFIYRNGKKYLKNDFLAFITGVIGTGFAVLLFFLTIIYSIPAEIDAAAEKMAIYASVTAHMPLMLIEGVFTVLVIRYIKKVKPELLKENE